MTIPKQWLQIRKSPSEFELDQLKQMADSFKLPFEKVAEKFADRPFGSMTAKWRSFVSKLGNDDELWYFCSSKESFGKMMGRQGYAIVRSGKIVDYLVTLQS